MLNRILGIAFVAWTWLGPRASVRQRMRPVGIAVIVASVTLGFWTLLAGFGFGWVRNLLSNGTVRSWAAPATGVGMAIVAKAAQTMRGSVGVESKEGAGSRFWVDLVKVV